MSPTLEHGQSVLVVRPVFSWNSLQRGDVVVLRRPGPPEGVYIKRIVALPDEEVKMAGGRVYADDVLLPEEYLIAPPLGHPGVNPSAPTRWWNGRRNSSSWATTANTATTAAPSPGPLRPDHRPRLAQVLAAGVLGVGSVVGENRAFGLGQLSASDRYSFQIFPTWHTMSIS